MSSLNDWLREQVIEKLGELRGEGYSCYPSDLSFRLFETANADGSYTCNAYKAKQWIKRYFDDLGEIYEEMQKEWEVKNPFINPEVFQLQVILFKAGDVLYKSKTFSELEFDEVEFTDELLNTIIKELKE